MVRSIFKLFVILQCFASVLLDNRQASILLRFSIIIWHIIFSHSIYYKCLSFFQTHCIRSRTSHMQHLLRYYWRSNARDSPKFLFLNPKMCSTKYFVRHASNFIKFASLCNCFQVLKTTKKILEKLVRQFLFQRRELQSIDH